MPAEVILSEIGQYIQSEIKASVGEDLSGKEERAVRVGLLVARLVLGAMLREDQEDPVWIRCDCGEIVSSKQRESRTIVTLAGTQVINRKKYYCPSCGQSKAPADERLGIGSGAHSAGVAALTSEFGGCFPYEATSDFLQRRFGIDISAKQAQRLCVRTGTQLAQMEQQAATAASMPGGTVVSEDRPKRLVISADGVMVHSDGAWTEMKCGAITSEEHGRTTLATMERAEGFGDLLHFEAMRRGLEYAREVVVLGDGAAWIWNLASLHFPGATEIVDWYHASQHLWEIAGMWYGRDSKQARDWVKANETRLMEDGVKRVIASIRRYKPSDEEGRRIRRENLHYFSTNANRMRYGTFKALGYPIGSGSVESACKQYGQGRMKLPGMRWKTQGIEAVAHLRSAVLNRRTQSILHAAALAA